MIIESFRNRFIQMKNNGNNVQYVLDIGAYRGDFTETVKSVWPTAIVRQFEADERQKSWLQDNAIIALLGDQNNQSVNYYTLPDDKITTGSSIFKEQTIHYASPIVIQKEMRTLDSLHTTYNFFGDWKNLGLIKLDTQGSELLILEGARQFLHNKQPRYILIECSWQQYNQGSPLLAEVVAQLDKLEYKATDIFDTSYDLHNNLLQTDILFERKQ